MERISISKRGRIWIAFGLTFLLCVILGGIYGGAQPASASPALKPSPQEGGFAGPESCANCHEEIHDNWILTRHAHAFSSPIFQQNWEEIGSRFTCLECHTTGYDEAAGTYAF